MKNYNEMAENVLRRIEEYEIEQKRKRKVWMRALTSLGCVGIVALMGIGMWKNVSDEPIPNILEGSIIIGENGTIHEDTDVKTPDTEFHNESFQNADIQADIQIEDNKIIIHPVDTILEQKMAICLLCDDFVEMTLDEMKDYYGVDFEPVVPADIALWENEIYGIYRRDGGTGEVYWDAAGIDYTNKDCSRSVHVEVDKGNLPLRDWFHYSRDKEKSVVCGVEMLIGVTENGYYFTEFMYQDVGFFIDTQGLSEEEFLVVITSIINKK